MTPQQRPPPGVFTTMRVVPSSVGRHFSQPFLNLPIPAHWRRGAAEEDLGRDRTQGEVVVDGVDQIGHSNSGRNQDHDDMCRLVSQLVTRICLLWQHVDRLLSAAQYLAGLWPEEDFFAPLSLAAAQVEGNADMAALLASDFKSTRSNIDCQSAQHKQEASANKAAKQAWLLRQFAASLPPDDGLTSYRVRFELDAHDPLPRVTCVAMASAKPNPTESAAPLLPTVHLDREATTICDAPDKARGRCVFEHKTTDRRVYTDAAERMAVEYTVASRSDVILWTTAVDGGEAVLTESSIANLIVEDVASGHLSSPSSDSGKREVGPLPGIMLATLIKSGVKVQMRDVKREEVAGSGGVMVYLCNALRGVWKVQVQS